MKMNKCLLIILFFCVFSYSAYSQFSLGLATGYVNNHLKSDIGTQVFTTIKNGNGIGWRGTTKHYSFHSNITVPFDFNTLENGRDAALERSINYITNH